MKASRSLHNRAVIFVFAACFCAFLVFIIRCGSSIEDISSLESSSSQLYHPRQHIEQFDVRKSVAGSNETVQTSVTSHENSETTTAASDGKAGPSGVPVIIKANEAESVDVLTGRVAYNNEFEVFPFTRFTLDRVFPVEPGLGRRVIEKPIGFRKLEIYAVLDRAVASLNKNAQKGERRFTLADFVEGVYRTVPNAGTQYEVFFRDGRTYRQVQVILPYSPAVVIPVSSASDHGKKIHIILSLSERTDSFNRFMGRFAKIVVEDPNLVLCVVYFGKVGLEQVKSVVVDFKKQYGEGIIRLIEAAGPFSRGRGLQIGVDSIRGNALVFLCDVDVVFTVSFLNRCRLHTTSGQSLYYPIVFSLYNPHILSKLRPGDVTILMDPPVISRETGFWRDFGYGMTCQYRNDFKRVGGFDVNASDINTAAGWGLEDVRLYRRHLQSGYVVVVRATDPGIFHIWHEKKCDPDLPTDQYHGCLRSRAFSEASHWQLGELVLKQRDRDSRSDSLRKL